MKKILTVLTASLLFTLNADPSMSRPPTLEVAMLHKLGSLRGENGTDYRCRLPKSYRVYLIDNFDQSLQLIPEVATTHGDLIRRILLSGRDDIEIISLNTSLSRGLAQVLEKLANGGCADGVISSIPGSNYSYHQVSTLLPETVELTPDNILDYEEKLKQLIRRIAFNGFPSLEWLKKIDVNSIKLREDARKLVFLETLGKLNIPVILPYGNGDSNYHGRAKKLNLLSLAEGTEVYSGTDFNGRLLPGFPTSPLSTGDALAVYKLVECPDRYDSSLRHLDVNMDGVTDFSYTYHDRLPYYNEDNDLAYAPPLLNEPEFKKIINDNNSLKDMGELSFVLSKEQYQRLRRQTDTSLPPMPERKTLAWLNPPRHKDIRFFNSQCRQRGSIMGTSLIPPMKIKERLP